MIANGCGYTAWCNSVDADDQACWIAGQRKISECEDIDAG